MERRSFLKSLSLLVAGGLGASFIKPHKKNKFAPKIQEYKFNPFEGCREFGYEFSVPIPFDYKLIDELTEINNSYSKLKVTTLYGALPKGISPIDGFLSTSRGKNDKIKNFDDFANYVKYAKSKGFSFVYLINSPKPFLNKEFKTLEPKLLELLDNLKSIGCKNIKVANTQLLEVFQFKDFIVDASTSFEYTNIKQIENILEIYPFINKINLAIDNNRNILLLKNLKEKYPDRIFEIMADENCLYGCPARISHPGALDCLVFPCRKIYNKHSVWFNICKSNLIFPWNLDFYAKLGFKNFKLMGKGYGMRSNIPTVKYVRDYFELAEKGIKDFYLSDFMFLMGHRAEKFRFSDYKLSEEILHTLPDINFFAKNGHLCSNRCEVSCRYCEDCAEKLNKIIC